MTETNNPKWQPEEVPGKNEAAMRRAGRKARHVTCNLEDYHKRPEWSRSQLEVLRQSPVLFYGRFVADPPLFAPKQSRDLDVGKVAHEVLTAPGGLDQVVVEIPAEVLNSQGHRKGKTWTEWSEDHAGLIQMTAAELEPVRAMVRNTYAHPEAGRLLAKAMHYEWSLVWTDEKTGLGLRARPDLIVSDNGGVVVVDFKTTRAVTPRDFARDVAQFGYHRQAAFYSEAVRRFGYRVNRFLFVAVDKSPAHECRVYELDEDSIAAGQEQVRELLLDLARRLDENDWQPEGFGDVRRIRLPEYALPSLELTIGGEKLEV